MRSAPRIDELVKLPLEDRLQLVEALWDSIAAEQADLPLSSEDERDLRDRLAAAKAAPGEGRSWPDVRKRILGGE